MELDSQLSTSVPVFATVPQKSIHESLLKKGFSCLIKNFVCRKHHTKYCFGRKVELLIPTTGELPDSQKIIIDILQHVGRIWADRDDSNVQEAQTDLEKYGLIGDILGTVLSTPVTTYFFAPVFSLMEIEVLSSIRKLIGYEAPHNGDGLFIPGVGFGTIAAIRMALQKRYKYVKHFGIGKGTNNETPCLFVSDTFYNIAKKAAKVCGLEEECCISISSDKTSGTINSSELGVSIESAIKRGFTPFMVIAALGSERRPIFDSLIEVSHIAREFRLWFHVDGSFGGPALFSKSLKTEFLSGIEEADSVLIGMERLLGAPYCTTLLVTCHRNLCQEAFGLGDTVLYEKSPLYDSKYDRGDGTLLTCRRPDVLKIWIMWKMRGANSLGVNAEKALAGMSSCVRFSKYFNCNAQTI